MVFATCQPSSSVEHSERSGRGVGVPASGCCLETRITAVWSAGDAAARERSLAWLEEVWMLLHTVCPGVHLAQLHDHLPFHQRELEQAFGAWLSDLRLLKARWIPTATCLSCDLRSPRPRRHRHAPTLQSFAGESVVRQSEQRPPVRPGCGVRDDSGGDRLLRHRRRGSRGRAVRGVLSLPHHRGGGRSHGDDHLRHRLNRAADDRPGGHW